MAKRISFKQKVNFDRQETEYLILPYLDHHPNRKLPEGLSGIDNPKEGEVYYFADENFERPAILTYVGRRGDTITDVQEESNGTDGSTVNNSRTLNTTVSETLEDAFIETSYLHIYSGPNVGVYLIESISALNDEIVIHESEPFFEEDAEIEYSVRTTPVFVWIDIAKPEDYLNIDELQTTIDETNQIPIEFISNFPLTSTDLDNLSLNNLADGTSPWTDNESAINNINSTIDEILTKVELRNLNLPPNSLFSADNISLTEAVEEIDNVVLTTERNIYISNLDIDIGIFVDTDDFAADIETDVVPAMQIGGSRNATEGLRTGVLFTSEYGVEGSYPFIRSDRNINTVGSALEPDYSWFPYLNTGMYSTGQNNISFSINDEKMFGFNRNDTESIFQFLQYDGTNLHEFIEFVGNNTESKIKINENRAFKLIFGNEDLLNVTFDSGLLNELNLYPWMTFKNSANLNSEHSLLRFDNDDGLPKMFLFNSLNDQIGAIMGDPEEPGVIDFVSTKAMNFVAENEYRGRFDTFIEDAIKTEYLSTSGVTLYKNQPTAVTYENSEYRDWVEYEESTDIENIDVGDYLIIEESVNGVIKRYFYDSESSGRFVHAIDTSTNRVFLKKYTTGNERTISSTISRVILNKVVEVSGNSRFILTGLNDNTDQFIEIGGLRQIPFEDVSLYSKTGRNIFLSPSGDNLIKISRTVDSTDTYSLPLFEFTDANRIRLASLTSDIEGDLILNAYGNKSIIFAREAYMLLNKSNPAVTTFEIAASKGEDEHNARLALHGSKGNLELYSTSKEGYFRIRNPLVFHNEIVDVTGAPTIPPARAIEWPDPIIDYPMPIDDFPDPVIPEIDDTERRISERFRDSDRVNRDDDRLTFRF